jgi:putative hydrolase of the HAD superfamily
MNIKGLLYDLDDTLINRENAFLGFVENFYETFINKSDYSYEEFSILMKNVDKKTKWSTEKELLFDELRKSVQLSKDSKYYVDFFWNSVVESVDPDLRANSHLEKLNDLKIPWGVVTNGYSFQHQKLKKSGVGDLAPFYMVSGDFGCHKPCEEIYYAAAEKLNLKCENILFVGDTAETDIVGAQKVGMKTAWVTMGRDYPLGNKPDFEIDHVTDLEKLLDLF